jgi:hypothetical protein
MTAAVICFGWVIATDDSQPVLSRSITKVLVEGKSGSVEVGAGFIEKNYRYV